MITLNSTFPPYLLTLTPLLVKTLSISALNILNEPKHTVFSAKEFHSFTNFWKRKFLNPCLKWATSNSENMPSAPRLSHKGIDLSASTMSSPLKILSVSISLPLIHLNSNEYRPNLLSLSSSENPSISIINLLNLLWTNFSGNICPWIRDQNCSQYSTFDLTSALYSSSKTSLHVYSIPF